MKQKIQHFAAAFAFMLGMGMFTALPAGAINVFNDKACPAGSTSTVCKGSADSIESPVQAVISTLLIAIGIVAVIMIVVGGLRYTLSNGDASRIKSAKDTVLYSVVGLVVAMLAYAIVNFVIVQFT